MKNKKCIKTSLIVSLFVLFILLDVSSLGFTLAEWPVKVGNESDWQYTYREMHHNPTGDIAIDIQFTLKILNITTTYITSRKKLTAVSLGGPADINWTNRYQGTQSILATESSCIVFTRYPGVWDGSEFSIVWESGYWAGYQDVIANKSYEIEGSTIPHIRSIYGFGDMANYSIEGYANASEYELDYYINEGAGITEKHFHQYQKCRFFKIGILSEYRSHGTFFYGQNEGNYSWYCEEYLGTFDECTDECSDESDDTLDLFDFSWFTSMNWGLGLSILGICGLTGLFLIIFIRYRKEHG